MAKHLTDKQKKQIVADYAELGSYSATARKHKVSATTVKNIVLSDPESVKKCDQKKEQNTLDMLEYLGTRKEKAQNLVDLCLDYMSKPEKLAAAQLNQLSTAMGTVIDKFVPITVGGGKDKGVFYLNTLMIADGFHSARRDILNHHHTEYVFSGGRGGTKSSFVGQMVVELLENNPQCHALCLRQYSNTLKDSVNSQIKWAIREQGLEDAYDYKTQPLEIIRKETKQKVYFRGADDPLKIKSIKPEFGYIGILWFEELDQFKGEEAVRSIEQSAVRGGDIAWILKSFNPPKTKDNWANKYITIPKEKRLVHHSTYVDSGVPAEWLGKTFIEEAEHLKEVNPAAYEHEYLGVPNGTGGMVFENVRAETITDETIRTFDRTYYGVDWGWYPDPWAFNAMYYNANKRILYIYDEARENKKNNIQTAAIIKQRIPHDEGVCCDSSEPKSVNDYIGEGLIAFGAEKGPGSVEYSHKWLQGLTAIIIDHKRCPYTYKEFSEYEYERNKDGEVITGYPDRNNHHIDAVRYATERVWRAAERQTDWWAGRK